MTVKVVILGGAGGVGASVAFNLLQSATPYEIVLVDTRQNMITSHLMDFHQMLPICGPHSARGGEATDVRDADVCVICASTPLRPNSSRSVFLQENAAILRETVEFMRTIRSEWRGIVLIATNPVDPLCTWFQRNSGIERERILGYSMNDTLRFRTIIADYLAVAASDVYAWVLGEHGEHSVLLFSRVTVSGRPILLDELQRTAIGDDFHSWYSRHVALDSGRTTTWTTGLGISRMVGALQSPVAELWPASVVLNGEYGISGASVTVPVLLGKGGLHDVQVWQLDDREVTDLRTAAFYVRKLSEAVSDLGSD